MKILGIETSCDETAVCIVKAQGGLKAPQFKILGNALYSQVKIHEQYGGVFPMMAKREHALNLVPLLVEALKAAGMDTKSPSLTLPTRGKEKKIKRILEREPGLFEAFMEKIAPIKKPKVDVIAVTFGPGLEPALWVGVNFAKALSELWDIPLSPVNHMEGHLVSVLYEEAGDKNSKMQFPALAALMSGGHTELVVMKDWTKYKIVGETRDDAVGEAFDKVARMLGLPYPGGPHISRLAAEDRSINSKSLWILPRPMIQSPDFDFSFSGLKTAVLYTLKKLKKIDLKVQHGIAREFEDAVADVLAFKIRNAIKKYKIRSLIIGGGVSANKLIRERLTLLATESGIDMHLPTPHLSTDNAVMIAIAGYIRATSRGKITHKKNFNATGNARISGGR